MATWLIVILSLYCGLSYGFMILISMLSNTKLRGKEVIEIIFSPIVVLLVIGQSLYEAIRDIDW